MWQLGPAVLLGTHHGQAEPIPKSHRGDTSLVVVKSNLWDEILLILSLCICLLLSIWLASFPFFPHLL